MKNNIVSGSHLSASKALEIYKWILATLSICTAILGAVVFLSNAQGTTRYFPPAPLATAFLTLLAATLLLAFSALFVFSKERCKIKVTKSGFKFLNLFPLAGVVALYLSGARTLSEGSNLWAVLLLITSLLSLPFAFSDLISINKTAVLASGYVRILFGLVIVVKTYLDLSVEMNAPLKLLIQFGAITMALHTAYRLRIQATHCNIGPFLFASVPFLLLSLLAAIGAVVEHFARNIQALDSHRYSNDYILLSLVLLSFAIPILLDLIGLSVADETGNSAEEVPSEEHSDTASEK